MAGNQTITPPQVMLRVFQQKKDMLILQTFLCHP